MRREAGLNGCTEWQSKAAHHHPPPADNDRAPRPASPLARPDYVPSPPRCFVAPFRLIALPVTLLSGLRRGHQQTHHQSGKRSGLIRTPPSACRQPLLQDSLVTALRCNMPTIIKTNKFSRSFPRLLPHQTARQSLHLQSVPTSNDCRSLISACSCTRGLFLSPVISHRSTLR